MATVDPERPWSVRPRNRQAADFVGAAPGDSYNYVYAYDIAGQNVLSKTCSQLLDWKHRHRPISVGLIGTGVARS